MATTNTFTSLKPMYKESYAKAIKPNLKFLQLKKLLKIK